MSSNNDVSPEMSPGDGELAHFGVKGMQWGKRKTDDSGGSAPARKKPNSSEIREARVNLQKQALTVQQAKANSKKFDKGSAERMMANDRVAEMKVDFLNNPDRVTASYLTAGEKYAAAAITVFVPFGAPAIGGNIAGRAAVRRTIAKKQSTGAYSKK